MTITKEQFERRYAVKSGLTVEGLHDLGRHAYPCECEYQFCEKWQMLSDENATDLQGYNSA